MKHLLTDVCQALPEQDRAEFREIARIEFGNGLSSTAEGARHVLRQLVMKRAAWISPVRHQRRERFLSILETFMARTAPDLAA